jgi:phage tail sheath protein FI
MPVTPTYPGVYIEEIPSGVHTITGVSTSIGAFVDYFSQGPMNEAVQIFSFADFERAFGGLDTKSEASYAIQQFFLNGGSEAWVVRTTTTTAGKSAVAAAIELEDGAGGTKVLIATAISPGQWGNLLRLDVDYGTIDPSTLFNLTVTEISFVGGTQQVLATETFRNLSMDNTQTNYAVAVVNGKSQLITLTLVPGAQTRPAQTGTASKPYTLLGVLAWQSNHAYALGDYILDANGNLQKVTVAGSTPVPPAPPPVWSTTLNATTNDAAPLVWTLVATNVGAIPEWYANHTYSVGDIIVDSNGNLEMAVTGGASNPADVAPGWVLAVGSIVNEAAGPVQWKLLPTGNGLVFPSWNPNQFYLLGAEIIDPNGNLQKVTTQGTSGPNLPGWTNNIGGTTNDGGTLVWTLVSRARLVVNLTDSMSVALNLQPPFATNIVLNSQVPSAVNFGWLAATLQTQIRAVHTSLANATVSAIGNTSTEVYLQFKAGTSNQTDWINFADVTGTLAADLAITNASTAANVQQYALGASIARRAQALPGGVAQPGSNGVWDPINDAAGVAAGLIGDQLAKTGMYALLDTDLFNILCIPVTALLPDNDAAQVATNATSLCTLRRAFYILDPPQQDGNRDTVQGIKTWLDNNASLRSRNSALYFPRLDLADPLNSFRTRITAPSGTIAGLYARTDSTRGVWKAPAGTETGLAGILSLEYKLTDGENGVLNPLAINCLRVFPVFGPVCWGARTLFGADQQADDYKYVPVRRFALYLEESLYRGTKWVVFEPNDEPLWAQIRLNIGAFMQSLFRQGAFQGQSPRDAYFVKCDSETTTQTDINNGIVNIVVGFAPLKPAEFVILKIQQIAGQIAT